MKAKTILSALMILPLLCAIAVPARAQAANSQQTLNQYVADLQSNPNDTALRGKIIALAQSMRPAPAIPEEARGHYVMATTFAEKAKSDTERAKNDSDLKLASAGFERAVAEYKAALLAAPWWADAYKKLAIAQKAAQQYDDAIASLNLYLLTQPADARDAQDEIYKLKALKQSAADDQRMAAQKAIDDQHAQQRAYETSPEGQLQALLKKIDGRRYFAKFQIEQQEHGYSFKDCWRFVLDIKDGFVVNGTSGLWGCHYDKQDYSVYKENSRTKIQGRVFSGSYTINFDVGQQFREYTYTISEDGSTITWHSVQTGVYPGTVDWVYVWQ